MNKAAIAAALGSAVLAGCATPAAIKEQATHTVSMMGELETSLRDFDRVQGTVLKLRLRSVARQEKDLEFAQGQTRVWDTARLANGDTGPANLLGRINTVAAEIEASDRRAKEKTAQLDAEFDKLLKPLASSDAKLGATQKAAAEFGHDLPWKTRFAEFRSFAAKVKGAVDDNRKKLQAAETSLAKE